MRDINNDLVGAAVDMGKARASLERHGRLPIHPVFAGDNMLGRFDGGIEIAVVEAGLTEHVVGPMIVNERCARLKRTFHVDDRRQRLVIDFDLVQQILRFGRRFGDGECHLLAGIADLVGCEYGKFRMFEVWEVWARSDRLQTRQVGGDDHPILSPIRFADSLDARMRVGAAQKGGVQHTGQHDVRHVLSATV